MGGYNVQALKSIYHWIYDSMKLEGKELTPTDWALYNGRAEGQPRQRNGYDCGLFTIMNSLCILNDLPLYLVEQSLMQRGRCQLWLHLMSLMDKGEEPAQSAIEEHAQSAIDLITPPPQQSHPTSVVDLRSPTLVPPTPTYLSLIHI